MQRKNINIERKKPEIVELDGDLHLLGERLSKNSRNKRYNPRVELATNIAVYTLLAAAVVGTGVAIWKGVQHIKNYEVPVEEEGVKIQHLAERYKSVDSGIQLVRINDDWYKLQKEGTLETRADFPNKFVDQSFIKDYGPIFIGKIVTGRNLQFGDNLYSLKSVDLKNPQVREGYSGEYIIQGTWAMGDPRAGNIFSAGTDTNTLSLDSLVAKDL